MKYLKKFEEQNTSKIIKYGDIGNFYHATFSKNIESLKKGISINYVDSSKHSKSQGVGFYVWNNIEKLKAWKGLSPDCDIIVKIQTALTKENFEIDYELHELDFNFFWQNLINIISKQKLNFYSCNSWTSSGEIIKFEKINSNNLWNISKNNFPYIIISNENIEKNDITMIDSDSVDTFDEIPSSSKNIGWTKMATFTGDANFIHQSMESLNKFGIKDKFKKIILDKCSALKYVGPKIFPTKFIKMEI